MPESRSIPRIKPQNLPLADCGLLAALLIDAAGSIFDVSADTLPQFFTGDCGASRKGHLIAAQEFGDFHGTDLALRLGADIRRIAHRQLVSKWSELIARSR